MVQLNVNSTDVVPSGHALLPHCSDRHGLQEKKLSMRNMFEHIQQYPFLPLTFRGQYINLRHESCSYLLHCIPLCKHSIYAIYAYIDPQNDPNVGIYGSPMECLGYANPWSNRLEDLDQRHERLFECAAIDEVSGTLRCDGASFSALL